MTNDLNYVLNHHVLMLHVCYVNTPKISKFSQYNRTHVQWFFVLWGNNYIKYFNPSVDTIEGLGV